MENWISNFELIFIEYLSNQIILQNLMLKFLIGEILNYWEAFHVRFGSVWPRNKSELVMLSKDFLCSSPPWVLSVLSRTFYCLDFSSRPGWFELRIIKLNFYMFSAKTKRCIYWTFTQWLWTEIKPRFCKTSENCFSVIIWKYRLNYP